MANAERIFAANWKLDGTRTSSVHWVRALTEQKELLIPPNRIIVAPPLHLLALVADQVAQYGLPIAVAAQDLDPAAEAFFHDPKGVKHTGQAHVADLIADCATHVIVGHSETRADKQLSDGDINIRLDIARNHKLKPIVCVAGIEQARSITNHDPQFPHIIAYEPPGNIGTVAADPAEANVVCEQIHELFPGAQVLYGGSVAEDNIAKFLAQGSISGVLVGNRSSDATFFQNIIRSASQGK